MFEAGYDVLMWCTADRLYWSSIDICGHDVRPDLRRIVTKSRCYGFAHTCFECINVRILSRFNLRRLEGIQVSKSAMKTCNHRTNLAVVKLRSSRLLNGRFHLNESRNTRGEGRSKEGEGNQNVILQGGGAGG